MYESPISRDENMTGWRVTTIKKKKKKKEKQGIHLYGIENVEKRTDFKLMVDTMVHNIYLYNYKSN